MLSVQVAPPSVLFIAQPVPPPNNVSPTERNPLCRSPHRAERSTLPRHRRSCTSATRSIPTLQWASLPMNRINALRVSWRLSTTLPVAFSPTAWNTFLPTSMPSVSSMFMMACLLVVRGTIASPGSLKPKRRGRTIPLTTTGNSPVRPQWRLDLNPPASTIAGAVHNVGRIWACVMISENVGEYNSQECLTDGSPAFGHRHTLSEWLSNIRFALSSILNVGMAVSNARDSSFMSHHISSRIPNMYSLLPT